MYAIISGFFYHLPPYLFALFVRICGLFCNPFDPPQRGCHLSLARSNVVRNSLLCCGGKVQFTQPAGWPPGFFCDTDGKIKRISWLLESHISVKIHSWFSSNRTSLITTYCGFITTLFWHLFTLPAVVVYAVHWPAQQQVEVQLCSTLGCRISREPRRTSTWASSSTRRRTRRPCSPPTPSSPSSRGLPSPWALRWVQNYFIDFLAELTVSLQVVGWGWKRICMYLSH